MSDPIWNNLHKTLDDQTTIEEAIDAAVGTHNDDPQAHLDVNQAVEVHRDNNVADHPAESVLNDKIHHEARSATAIVGGDDPENYNTVEDAVAFIASVGAGKVKVLPGVYTLNSFVELDATINIEGTDPEEVEINTDYNAGNYFFLPTYTAGEPRTQRISNIRVVNANDYGIRTSTNSSMADLRLVIENCELLGMGNKVYTSCGRTVVRDCLIEATDDRAFVMRNILELENTVLRPHSTSDSPRFMSNFTSTVIDYQVILKNTEFLTDSAATPNWWSNSDDMRFTIDNCLFENAPELATFLSNQKIINSRFNGRVDQVLNLSNLHQVTTEDIVCTNNIIISAGSNQCTVRLGSQTVDSVVTGNIISDCIQDSGTNNVVANNVSK